MALIVVVNFYAVSQLHQLTLLHEVILITDASIEEEKRLLKIFLAQTRSAEKFVVFRNKDYYNQFVDANHDFAKSVGKITTLIGTSQELTLLEQIRNLHDQYATSLLSAAMSKPAASRERGELSDDIRARVEELKRLHEQVIDQKKAAARDQSAVAARVVSWLTLGGIGLVVLLAYLHARR